MCFSRYLQNAVSKMDPSSRQNAIKELQRVTRTIEEMYLRPMQKTITNAYKSQLTLAFLARFSRLSHLVEIMSEVVDVTSDVLRRQTNLSTELNINRDDVQNSCKKLDIILHESARMQSKIWHVAQYHSPKLQSSQFVQPNLCNTGPADAITESCVLKDLGLKEAYDNVPVNGYDLDTKICCLHDSADELLSAARQCCDSSEGYIVCRTTRSRVEALRSMLPEKIFPLKRKPDKRHAWITCSQLTSKQQR